jgi:hypothetical protein
MCIGFYLLLYDPAFIFTLLFIGFYYNLIVDNS